MAHTRTEASTFHEGAEGFDRGTAGAELVMILPTNLQEEKVGWPREELLKGLGYKTITGSESFYPPIRAILGNNGRQVLIGKNGFLKSNWPPHQLITGKS